MQAPYLQIAFVCDSIPKDGKMPVKELVRKISAKGETKTIPSFPISVTLFAAFVAGDYNGKAILGVEIIAPDGESAASVPNSEIEFQESLNHLVHVTMLIEDVLIQKTGIYWCNVKLNGNLVARIPLEVSYQQRLQPQQQTSHSKKHSREEFHVS